VQYFCHKKRIGNAWRFAAKCIVNLCSGLFCFLKLIAPPTGSVDYIYFDPKLFPAEHEKMFPSSHGP
jgi:hypothetical protein